MNKGFVFLGIAIMLFAVFTAGVKAVELEGDFSLQTDCFTPDQEIYTLSNNTSSQHTYTITAVGENADWINLNGKWIGSQALTVTLGAGQSTELVAFVKPQSCYIQPGTYEVRVRVENGEVEEFVIIVIVLSTRELELDVSPNQISLEQCGEETFTIELENTGKSNERVLLSVSGIPSAWADFAQQEFVLEKNSKRTVEMKLGPACSAAVKDYRFEVVAGIEGTSFTAREEMLLEMVDAQDIAISANALNACNDAPSTGTIEVKNNGNLEDDLKLSVSGLDWASLEVGKISVEAGQTAEITVNFEKSDVAEGSYAFTVSAHSNKFNKDTLETFNVNVSDCYSVSIESVEVEGEEGRSCLEENPTYKFSLVNGQTETIELDASVSGMNAAISPAKVSIPAGESRELEVELDLAGETAGEKEFSLLLESRHFSLSQVYSLAVEDCFAVEVDYGGLTEAIDVNANCEAEPITVTIKNIGTRANTVNARVSGIEWLYIEPTAETLQPGEERGIFLYISPPYDIKEGLHEASLSVEARDLSEKQGIAVNVYGGLYADMGKASVSADAELRNLLEEVDKTVEVTVTISNDSNALLRIEDINVLNFYSEHVFEETTLQPGEETTAVVKLYLGKSWALDKFTVPIQFLTNKGTVTRDVEVSLSEEEEGEDQEAAAQVGLFSLGNAKDALLVGIAVLVIALVVMIGLRMSKPQPSATLSSLAEQVHAEPGKKLEEIGKKKKKGARKKK